MLDLLSNCSGALTLAETAGNGVGAAAPAPVVYWLAIVLVTAGLGILGIAISSWMRRQPGVETAGVRDFQEMSAAATPVPERSEAAAVPPVRKSAAAHPSPTTIEAQNLLRLMGEAEELCTRLGRELDDKAERLERLLARAEGRLGAAPAPIAAQAMPAIVIPRSTAPMAPQAPAAAAPTAPEIYNPRPEIVTRPVAVPQPVLSATPASTSAPLYYTPTGAAAAQPAPSFTGPQLLPTQHAAPVVPAPAGPKRGASDPFGVDPLTRDIYTLADAGHSPSAIAQQLGQHTGKVELILALRSA